MKAAVVRLDKACRAAEQGRRAARALASWAKPHGLSEAAFRLLWRLWSCPRQASAGDGRSRDELSGPGSNHESLDQITLAAELALSASQISALVEQLGRGGWIQAVTKTGDRRRQLWQLTAMGQTQMQALAVLGTSLTWPGEAAPPSAWNTRSAQGDAA